MTAALVPPTFALARQQQQVAAPTSAPTPAPQPSQAVTTTAPAIVQQVTVTPNVPRSDLLSPDTQRWGWEEFRDYVVAKITETFGPFPRDARKEHAIFRRFFSEYGSDAIAIVDYAFGPICGGMWRGAPISINRFCKASDDYFAKAILERLADVSSGHQTP